MDQAEELHKRWQQAEKQEGIEAGWYNKAVDYWDKQEASYNGVLGGYGFVSSADIKDSEQFLKKALGQRLRETKGEELVAVDCGAGVGRVSQELLLRYFGTVDLLEPSSHLIQQAKSNLAAVKGKQYPKEHAAGEFLQMGLEKFTPAAGRYDVIWVQWALLYLTDDDLVALFERCHKGLKPGGVIFVKENVCKEGFEVDEEDSSVTRSHEYMLDLFKQAGLKVLYSALQKNFPRELYKVRMYALQPQ